MMKDLVGTTACSTNGGGVRTEREDAIAAPSALNKPPACHAWPECRSGGARAYEGEARAPERAFRLGITLRHRKEGIVDDIDTERPSST